MHNDPAARDIEAGVAVVGGSLHAPYAANSHLEGIRAGKTTMKRWKAVPTPGRRERERENKANLTIKER